MVWLEVETKVRLKNSEIPLLRKKIKKIARFHKRGKKVDDYFAIHAKGYPKKAFRIRATKDAFEINFKKHLREFWTKRVVVKQEFEFKLKGKEEVLDLLALFKDLGFREWVRKVKFNETYKHKKNKKISIEINRVKHLGYFMEIEYLCQKSEMKRAIRAIENTLDELGIDPKKVDNTGYTKMLWKKGTLEKREFINL